MRHRGSVSQRLRKHHACVLLGCHRSFIHSYRNFDILRLPLLLWSLWDGSHQGNLFSLSLTGDCKPCSKISGKAYQSVTALKGCKLHDPGHFFRTQTVLLLKLVPALKHHGAVVGDQIEGFLQGWCGYHVEAQHDQLGSLAATTHHTTLLQHNIRKLQVCQRVPGA